MARIPLAYPKIPSSKAAPEGQCIAFEKYDGTNFHWVWDRELGWYAFGMRRNRYDFDDKGISEFHQQHPDYPDAPDIFREEFACPLEEIFLANSHYNGPEVTVFTEYVGPNSFAGLHKLDDPKQLVLFDVESTSKMVAPEQFIDDFSTLNIARTVYRGRLTGKFIHDVRHGHYDVAEGVICKGTTKENQLWMVKIKTNAYLEKLKSAFSENWENYWE